MPHVPATFFDQQDAARKRSRVAVFGFALVVLLTVVSVGLITLMALVALDEPPETAPQAPREWIDFLVPVMATSSFCFFLISLGTLHRHLQMRKGPDCIMKAIGGAPLDPHTLREEERRLQHIVEEMSLASGVPVPSIYIIESPSVNAFAVGLSPERAGVGVTRGALAAFNRDELQGVIAHEFSHILWGDMRLNTRLIAWLAGLFLISELGVFFVRLGIYSPRGRRNSKDNGGIFLAIFGAAIWVCGSVGLLFGRILQASISRQREYLADASAVQFTRNPAGIGNALRKLGKGSRRARLEAPETMECAHMMFGNVKHFSFLNAFATHPPLHRRIRQVLPDWDGSYLEPGTASAPASPAPPPAASRRPQPAAGLQALHAAVGTVTATGLQQTRSWLQHLPAGLREDLHDPDTARAMVCLLLLSDAADFRNAQVRILNTRNETSVLNGISRLQRACPRLHPEDRLPLLDLCVPALRTLPTEAKHGLLTLVAELIQADGKVSLYEYAVQQVLRAALEPEAASKARQRQRVSVQACEREISLFLTVLARIGADTESQVQESFAASLNVFREAHGGIGIRLLPAEACRLSELNQAFDPLSRLPPQIQQRLLQAGLAAISVDGEIRDAENNLFRAAAAALHIPLPPGRLSLSP